MAVITNKLVTVGATDLVALNEFGVTFLSINFIHNAFNFVFCGDIFVISVIGHLRSGI